MQFFSRMLDDYLDYLFLYFSEWLLIDFNRTCSTYLNYIGPNRTSFDSVKNYINCIEYLSRLYIALLIFLGSITSGYWRDLFVNLIK